MKRGRRFRNGGNTAIRKPQRQKQHLDLTKFQPGRFITVATEAVLAGSPLALGFFNDDPPRATVEIPAISAFRKSFQSSRVTKINIYFDQRGSSSTGAVPRVTAFLTDDISTAVDPTKITDLANFAGSGLNQISPGRDFNLPVGPKFSSGQFGTTSGNTLILVGQDYEGTVRIQTTFEVLGPPINFAVTPQ